MKQLLWYNFCNVKEDQVHDKVNGPVKKRYMLVRVLTFYQKFEKANFVQVVQSTDQTQPCNRT